ncbi:cysteine proteinase [Trichocladium antarcticum]|uniref:Ubiquitin carboxyl-terminal hydrolase n=1 Tax=Trichocladium antarcticum TaxID=1450529 RepID=A0AAN6UFM7_9PEZI|nr:cysteine proteinase [Trichocladium antarcticum]
MRIKLQQPPTPPKIALTVLAASGEPNNPSLVRFPRMPDKTLRVVTYAAGASLAAVTLIYVFGPTYFLDSEPSSSPTGPFSSRNKGAVGLSNPANDCFINSVLQALAGLGDLRLYLIREIHRRGLDELVYLPVPCGALVQGQAGESPLRLKDTPDWKLDGLLRGSVTKSLKDILDALNERPIYKKTISAAPFLVALEAAFRQRISRQQQDAQEFLQVVAERLCDEYHAGRRARRAARRIAASGNGLFETRPIAVADDDARSPPFPDITNQAGLVAPVQAGETTCGSEKGPDVEDEEGFPLEGKVESQIECLTCGFKPRPTESTFCTLTLNVPQVPATNLGTCFDGMFKTEYIDDFKCEKCRLLHAVASFESERQRSSSETARAKAHMAVEKLRLAIDTDPENPPEDVMLPELRHAPKRRIARHIRLTGFPKVLAIHLSRSIFDASRLSQKNSAKVVFPEEMPLGGLLQQRKYKLLGVVTHKGSHHSGHYESFRRQNIYPPFSNPSTFQASGAYSRAASPASTPRLEVLPHDAEAATSLPSRQDVSSYATGTNLSPLTPGLTVAPAVSPRNPTCTGTGEEESTIAAERPSPAPLPQAKNRDTDSSGSAEASPRSSTVHIPLRSFPGTHDPGLPNDSTTPPRPPVPASKHKQRKQQARWWRISDEKVKEASTRDVLAMQREVYLLFYELERPNI